jgi:hypothetical protein
VKQFRQIVSASRKQVVQLIEGIRESNILPLSLNTWYKYVYKLGLHRSKANPRTKKHVTGIRASRPNEIWHVDITQFETEDRQKNFIYLTADNYSKKILSFKIADRVKALFRKETILSAYQAINEQRLC